MKFPTQALFLILSCMIYSTYSDNSPDQRIIFIDAQTKKIADSEWTIIGAGPAGIITIGVLCDLGVPAKQITWIDPSFTVGRMGEFYNNVPGNTKTKSFIDFLKACKTFQQVSSPAIDKLYSLPPDSYEKLQVIVEPLQDITNYLCTQVNAIQATMDSLFFTDGVWHIGYQNTLFSARHVVLAVGSYPKTLDYCIKDIIPLDYALDTVTLHALTQPSDRVAVIGSSHSAILVMKSLTETIVDKILNLYTTPLTYAIDMGTWTLNNTHGLKGIAAEWAREVLEKNTPKNLTRCLNTPENRELHLPHYNKIVYAIGYERNSIPEVTINNATSEITFDPETGIIGPRIFGIGIAFPGSYIDPAGNKEQLVGLNSFMKYAQKVIPQWILEPLDRQDERNDQIRQLSYFDDLFTIQLL